MSADVTSASLQIDESDLHIRRAERDGEGETETEREGERERERERGAGRGAGRERELHIACAFIQISHNYFFPGRDDA